MNNAVRFKPLDIHFGRVMGSLVNNRSRMFGLMIIGALIAFEIFNFSTTEFALTDVLGGLKFGPVSWATILSIAFCGIDFAGVARLFTPEQGADEPAEVWYLFGAWILAAAMNATLTWWGVSVAIATHTSQGSVVISGATIQKVVPIFVAVMVWVIRIMIIGTFSMAGERMFNPQESRPRRSSSAGSQYPLRNEYQPQRPQVSGSQSLAARPVLAPASSFKPQPKPMQRPENSYVRPSAEPTYHNLASAPRHSDSSEERS